MVLTGEILDTQGQACPALAYLARFWGFKTSEIPNVWQNLAEFNVPWKILP
jgi:hypothetical protein